MSLIAWPDTVTSLTELPRMPGDVDGVLISSAMTFLRLTLCKAISDKLQLLIVAHQLTSEPTRQTEVCRTYKGECAMKPGPNFAN